MSYSSHNFLLSYGALKKILDGETIHNAVLQVLGYKQIPGSNNSRFRLLLNDGVDLFAYALLATPLNNLIYDNTFEKYTIFKLKNYVFNEIASNKKVIICIDVEVLIPGSEVNVKIEKSDNELTQTQNSNSVLITASKQEYRQSFNFESLPSTSNFTVGEKYDNEVSGNENCSRHSASISVPGQKKSFNFKSFRTPSTATQMQIRKAGSETVGQRKDNSLLNLIPRSELNQTVDRSPIPRLSDIAQNWDTARANNAESPNSSNNLFISSISNISPYNRKWKIKARVIYKTPIINYNNTRGQGRFFSFYLLDGSGEIKATAFNDNVEKFFKSLEINKIYLVTNASVKRARENSPVKGDFELTIENCTQIELCLGDEESVPVLSFKFPTIAEVLCLPVFTYTDVIGICMQVSDISFIITKLNKEIVKRSIVLFDDSGKSITVTLWGSEAENFKLDSNDVIAIKNAKITNFNGTSLTFSPMSMIFISPQVQRAVELKAWFENLTPAVVSQSVLCDFADRKATQMWKTISDVYSDSSSSSEMPLYYNTKATIVNVKKEKSMYQACSFPGCLKKVTNLNNGFYKCAKCNKDYDTFNWTLILPLEIADFSGSQWTIAFTETAENLIGMNSEDLSGIKSEDEDKFNEILCDLNLKSYIFKMRCNLETFSEDTRLKTAILNFECIQPISYCKKLLADIKKLRTVINNN